MCAHKVLPQILQHIPDPVNLSLETGIMGMKDRMISMLQNLLAVNLVVLGDQLPDRPSDTGLELRRCEISKEGIVEGEI